MKQHPKAPMLDQRGHQEETRRCCFLTSLTVAQGRLAALQCGVQARSRRRTPDQSMISLHQIALHRQMEWEAIFMTGPRLCTRRPQITTLDQLRMGRARLHIPAARITQVVVRTAGPTFPRIDRCLQVPLEWIFLRVAHPLQAHVPGGQLLAPPGSVRHLRTRRTRVGICRHQGLTSPSPWGISLWPAQQLHRQLVILLLAVSPSQQRICLTTWMIWPSLRRSSRQRMDPQAWSQARLLRHRRRQRPHHRILRCPPRDPRRPVGCSLRQGPRQFQAPSRPPAALGGARAWSVSSRPRRRCTRMLVQSLILDLWAWVEEPGP
mmetsp:Transcript_64074/g.171452  ORF Transcript_64074/g.171452 Transcript_64074/m.171452 type:complete len:321 (-) Transcript_64074:353-1315(-)